MIKFYSKFKQNGAMFGLDARIALIVVSLIAVIGSAQLMSSIQQSEYSRLITDIKAVKSAYQNFVSDTQYKLTSYSNSYYYNASELVSLNKDNAKPYTLKYRGPYINYNQGANSNELINPKSGYRTYIVSRSFKNSWASADGSSKCTDSDCFLWVLIKNVNHKTAKLVDIKVDGATSETSGTIRLIANGSDFDLFYPIIKE